MPKSDHEKWIKAICNTIASYRKLIDATVVQLTDDEFFTRPASEMNSVAVILRHLGGNLKSRWTDFLTTDGEKPDRDRDSEFEDWQGDRESLMKYFDQGWQTLESAVNQVDESNFDQPIFIRGESHSIAQALARSVTHLSYHAGQISLLSRLVHQGEWKWLTVSPGASDEHNQNTWGTSRSQSIFSGENPNDSQGDSA